MDNHGSSTSWNKNEQPDMTAFEAPLFSDKPLTWLLELTTNIGVQHKSYCSQPNIQCWLYVPSHWWAFLLVVVTTHPIFVTISNDDKTTTTPQPQTISHMNPRYPFCSIWTSIQILVSYFNINYEFSINWRFSNFLWTHEKYQ